MRNYALTTAVMNGTMSCSPVALLRNWLARQRFARLTSGELGQRGMDDSDRQWILSLPLDCSPDVALADRLTRRARLEKGKAS